MKAQLKLALRRCLAMTVGLVIGACHAQYTANNMVALAGVYALVSVDGKPVPATVSHEGAALQVLSGTFTISADGTCSTKTIFVPPSGAEVTREVNATYSKNGAQLTMQWKGAGTTVGTIDGKTFTMDNEGLVFVYMK